MTKNKLTDLNNHLFAQLERLNDEINAAIINLAKMNAAINQKRRR